MSWWNTASVSNLGIGNFASEALKKAQKRIDKALDIQAEDGTHSSDETAATERVASSPPPAEESEFWNTWLSSDKLGSLKSKSPTSESSTTPGSGDPSGKQELSGAEDWSSTGFSPDFFSSTISSSLSKVKSLQKKAEASSLLKKKSPAKKEDGQVASKSLSSPVKSPSVDKNTDSSKPPKDNSGENRVTVKSLRPSSDVTQPLEITVPQTSISQTGGSSDADLLMTRKTPPSSEPPGILTASGAKDTVAENLDTDAKEFLKDTIQETDDIPTAKTSQLDRPGSESPGLVTSGDVEKVHKAESRVSVSERLAEQNLSDESRVISDTQGIDSEHPSDVPQIGVESVGVPASDKELSGQPDRTADVLSVSTVTNVVSASNKSDISGEITEPSGWGEDVSLSLITVSQMSSVSDSSTMDMSDMMLSRDRMVVSDDEKEHSDVTTATDSVAVSGVQAPDQSDLVMSSGTAWDIPELSESALLVNDSNSVSPRQLDNAAHISPVGGTEEITTDTSESVACGDKADPAANNTLVNVSSQGNDEDPALAIQQDLTGDEKSLSEDLGDSLQETTIELTVSAEGLPSTGILDDVPAAMGDSTDTQEELSEGNRTLTADEIHMARMSSESSQATLELSSEDVREERGFDDIDRYTPEPGDISQEEHSRNSAVTDERADEIVGRSEADSGAEAGKCEADTNTDNTANTDLQTITDKSTTPANVTAPGAGSSSISGSSKRITPVASKENLTSSSYVKTMLEEAMVESLVGSTSGSGPPSDSHGDSSHSSSDMVRIESGPTSGHTSADEIETNTSSDIEIISHISTPTPNGEGRLFDLSPLRHSLSRSVRRHSPPGHKRSDSSSSGQSRNGEDLLSPDKQMASIAGSNMHRAHHHSNKEAKIEAASVGHQEGTSKALETENLLKKLAETAEVLDAREKRLLEMSRENMDLVESNNILRQQLEQSEEAREAEMTDLNTLTEEFTNRMGEAEKKIQAVLREKEQIRKKLQDTEAELVKRANDKATERIMREKDQQIAELLEEGEKLSKQQLQSNNIIKKLRVKEKENDAHIKSQKQKLDQNEAEIEKLHAVLDNKVDNEKKQTDAINQLNSAVQVQESEINRLKGEQEDSVERIRSMQVALDNSYKEIAELHKANASRASQMQEEALSSEIKARRELQITLEQYQHQAKLEQEQLYTQIEDHQLVISRMEKEHGRREDILKQEISDLQQRLQEAEDRNQDLTHSVTQATRPLLRQIENLQSTYAAQVNAYEKVERNLTERLTESQTSLALAQEKERSANDSKIELDVKLSTLESQVSKLRQEKSKLQASLDVERTKMEVLEDARNNESAQMDALKQSYEKDVANFKKDLVMSENHLEMEKVKTESERKKVQLLHEQLREKDIQLNQARQASRMSTPTFSRENSFTVELQGESPMNISQHEELLEKSLMMASSNGNKTSLYESLRQAGATTIVENLQSQLKMRDGEIVQLQSDIQELERTREAMARELVSLSNQNEVLEEQAKDFPEYQAKHKDLDQRYQALLQMYGEKVEEAEELRLDLQDIKDMYKAQINELLKNH